MLCCNRRKLLVKYKEGLRGAGGETNTLKSLDCLSHSRRGVLDLGLDPRQKRQVFLDANPRALDVLARHQGIFVNEYTRRASEGRGKKRRANDTFVFSFDFKATAGRSAGEILCALVFATPRVSF